MATPASLPRVNVSCIGTIAGALRASLQRVRGTATRADVQNVRLAGWEEAAFAAFAADPEARAAAQAIHAACTTAGFFYIIGYTQPAPALERRLDEVSREFFRLPEEEKMEIAMSRGGRAWRGFFPVGGELTSGRPDVKEGLYFAREATAADDLRVGRSVPLFGPNLFPARPPEMREVVLTYMEQCEVLAAGVACLMCLALQLPPQHLLSTCCADPLYLFRIFHYPPPALLRDERLRADVALWGVGEHTDYGLITLLRQDEVGGLEVRDATSNEWVAAPPVPETLVVNVGDMLEAMTHGLYRSTPHRVRNPDPNRMRISFPFFFDPGFDAKIEPLPLGAELREVAERRVAERSRRGERRWDDAGSRVSVSGTYGAYLMRKVGRVFPELGAQHL